MRAQFATRAKQHKNQRNHFVSSDAQYILEYWSNGIHKGIYIYIECYQINGVFLPIFKLSSILAMANLLAHNNISQICYCSQDSLQKDTVNCSFSDNLTPLGETFILLAMVRLIKNFTYMNYYERINVLN